MNIGSFLETRNSYYGFLEIIPYKKIVSSVQTQIQPFKNNFDKSIFIYYIKISQIFQGVIVMFSNNLYMVKTWTGDIKPVKKIAIFPERDQQGDIFFKIEGHLNGDYFMINYYYDQEKAVNEFYKLLDGLMKFQISNLQTD